MNKDKKRLQLGQDPSTAANKLKKMILFQLVQNTKCDRCYQCSEKIKTAEELSIEHIIPWLDSENPKELFFDISNIAFSHLKCNIAASRKIEAKHGTRQKYKKGCRCEICKTAVTLETAFYRAKRKVKTGKDRK